MRVSCVSLQSNELQTDLTNWILITIFRSRLRLVPVRANSSRRRIGDDAPTAEEQMETVSMFPAEMPKVRNERENKHYANDDEFVYVASDCGAAGAVGGCAALARQPKWCINKAINTN